MERFHSPHKIEGIFNFERNYEYKQQQFKPFHQQNESRLQYTHASGKDEIVPL
jgi:hypothetical protein